MKKSSIEIFLFISTSFLLTACGKPPHPPTQTDGIPEVKVITVQPQQVAFKTELPGRTVPYLIADIRPQVNGLVKSRKFSEGSDVKAGELLYEIDPAMYRSAYNSNVAALTKAQANLTSTRLKAERLKELVAIQAVSRQDYDDAAAALNQSEADVAAARASVESSRINLGYTRLDAPISGRIGKSNVTPGALVTANQSGVLATIQQLDPIYVDVQQPSAVLLRLRQALARGDLQKRSENAATVRLVLEDGSHYPLEGKLEFSDVTVDQSTGAVTLRAVFPNPNAALLPGMYVRAVLQERVDEHAVLVPQRAVSRDSAGKPFVFVVGNDQKLQRRALETERAWGDQWVVLRGLEVGDQLVVEGLQRAAPGITVKTKPWTTKASPSNLVESHNLSVVASAASVEHISSKG